MHVTVIVPFTTIYASLESHKSDLSTDVLNLNFLMAEYRPPDKSLTSIDFLVTNFDTVKSFINLMF